MKLIVELTLQFFRDVDDIPTELLEIFSISVCAYDHDGDSAFNFRGKVKCFDCRGCVCIFDSDTEDTGGSEVSTSGNIVKLVPDLGRVLLVHIWGS